MDYPATRLGFELPATIPEGARRNTLQSYAASLWGRADHPDAEGLTDAVLAAARDNCEPPFPESEALEIARYFTTEVKAGPSPEYAAKAKEGTEARAAKDAEPFPLAYVDDITLSKLFAERKGGELRYAASEGKWWAYDAKRGVWRRGDNAVAARELLAFVDALSFKANALPPDDEDHEDPRAKAMRKYRSQRARSALLKDCAARMVVQAEEFDASPHLLNVKNGTLELGPTLNFRAHRASDLLTKVAGCDYDPEAGYGEWGEFLRQTFEGYGDAVPEYLREVVGLAVAGDVSAERFYVCEGKPRTGKSTFTDTVASMLGDYAIAASPNVLRESRGAQSGSTNADLRAFKGARLAIVSEWPAEVRLDVATTKRLTGRDLISAREPFEKRPAEFRNTATILLNTNYLPRATEDTIFSSGRAVVVPFNNVRPEGERDTGLRDRLAQPEALSGILNWALAGLAKHYQGLSAPLPAVCAEAVADYALDSNNVARFVSDRCKVGDGYRVTGQAIYAAYQDYCEGIGEFAKRQAAFYKALEAQGFKRAKRATIETPTGPKQVRNLFEGIDAGTRDPII